MTEIERKFRLDFIPSIDLGQGEEIFQGYLLVNDGELRIRRKAGRSYITVKGDGTLSREEWEAEVPAWVFDQLWPATDGRRIEKTRYPIQHEGMTLELDEYHGSLKGLVILECEFLSLEASQAFELPEWASDAVDVTAEKAYKNKNLAVQGMHK